MNDKEKYERVLSELVKAKGQLRDAGIRSPEDIELRKLIDDIKEKVPIVTLAKKLYAPSQLTNPIHPAVWYLDHCPFCKERDSMCPEAGYLIFDNLLETYHCDQCSAKGDIFSLYSQVHSHMHFGEVLKNLADFAGVEPWPRERTSDSVVPECLHNEMNPDPETSGNQYLRHIPEPDHIPDARKKVDALYVEFMREAIALNGKLPCPRPPTSGICKYCDTNKDPVEACVEVFLTFSQWKEGR